MYIVESELFEKENRCLEALEIFQQAHADVFGDAKKMWNMNSVISKLGTSVTQMGLIPTLCYYDRIRSENKESAYSYVLELMQKLLVPGDERAFTRNWLEDENNRSMIDKESFLLTNIALKRTFRTYDFMRDGDENLQLRLG